VCGLSVVQIDQRLRICIHEFNNVPLTTDNGQRTTDNGQRTTDNGSYPLARTGRLFSSARGTSSPSALYFFSN
jgi:hypothetical protein